MKRKYASSTFIDWCSIFSAQSTCKQCSCLRIFCVLTILLYFCALADCNSNFNETVENHAVNGDLSPSPKSLSATYSSSEDEYDYYYEENNSTGGNGGWRRHDNSKIAQVVIYCTVILISLGGILIKYFVTQYETSQIKAQEQLSYRRLHNQA